jgi:hypothetical protein
LEGDLLGLNLGDSNSSNNSGTSLPKPASNVDLLGGFDSGVSAETIKPSTTPVQPSSDLFDPFGLVMLTQIFNLFCSLIFLFLGWRELK